MIQEQRSVTKIKQWLAAVNKGEKPFQEAKAWEILESIQGNSDHALSGSEYGQLYAELARARYERSGHVDPLVDRWTSQALLNDDSNQLAHQLKLKWVLDLLKKISIPTKFPPIRETDHRSAKKKMAEEYNQIAKHFLVDVKHFNMKWDEMQNTINHLSMTSQVAVVNGLVSYLTKFKKPFTIIEAATNEYMATVTDVYYSKTQSQLLNQATNEIEQLSHKWTDLLEEHRIIRHEETALDQLHSMVGLEDVKREIEKLYQFLHYQKERLKQGFQSEDNINLHMILTGNPGTGKTHLARLMAKIYYELGLLERDAVYEVDRTHLVGAYVGQTEENTIKAIEHAAGGILFIDEAYSLRRAGAAGNDYGQTVIDTLVSAMTSEKYGKTMTVFMAGYPNEMTSFLRSNLGLRSRFPEQNHLHIENYTIAELLQIGDLVALENDYLLTNGAKIGLKKQIERAQVDESFGNARAVNNIIMDAIFQKGSQLSLEEAEIDDFVFLQAEDFKDGELDTGHHALQSLEELTGLAQIKMQMTELTSFVYVQQARREKGLQTLPLQLHSVFSGNPGTGKTTVAKLYAQALEEIGLLKRGHLIVASRADLVAGYAGQTAQRTKEKIRDALGGVLFIDEAYSLFSTGQDDFGREAINTIVQEMTDHEENLVVILAGYENEMQLLLNSNPGLRSRFKKHLHFEDYSKQELIEIIEHRAQQFGYQFSQTAKEIMAHELVNVHPANGRYAVDLFDRLVQQQSLRLSRNSEFNVDALQEITEEDVNQMIAEKGE